MSKKSFFKSVSNCRIAVAYCHCIFANFKKEIDKKSNVWYHIPNYYLVNFSLVLYFEQYVLC